MNNTIQIVHFEGGTNWWETKLVNFMCIHHACIDSD